VDLPSCNIRLIYRWSLNLLFSIGLLRAIKSRQFRTEPGMLSFECATFPVVLHKALFFYSTEEGDWGGLIQI
jgi:hypothetical protein